MNEFKVNAYITLKLEDNKTNIYINGKLINQCKFLILNIPINNIRSFDEVESIDEAVEKLDNSLEHASEKNVKIPPEVEFWAHCSNIQVWAEHEYNTQLLQSELAFSLLNELIKVGDPIAKSVFKDEIAKRFESGYLPVIFYLLVERYPEYYLNEEERFLVFSKIDQKKIFKVLEKDIAERKRESYATLILRELILNYKYLPAKQLYNEYMINILQSTKKKEFTYLFDNDGFFGFSIDELNNLLFNSPIFNKILDNCENISKTFNNLMERLTDIEKEDLLNTLLLMVNYSEEYLTIASYMKKEFEYIFYKKKLNKIS